MNPAPHVVLLRHGATEGEPGFCGRTDRPLSALGWQQMHAAIAGYHWAGVVSSPLTRCLAFAQELSQREQLPLQVEAAWRELDFGDWDGLTAAQVMALAPSALDNFWRDPWQYPPPGGETLQACWLRVEAALQGCTARLSNLPWLLVTHGGVMRLLLAHVRGISPQELSAIEVPHAACFGLHFDGVWRECAR